MEAAAPASDDLVEADHGVDRAVRLFDSHREPAISGRNIDRPGRSDIEEPGVSPLKVAPHGNRGKAGLPTMRAVEVHTNPLACSWADVAAHTRFMVVALSTPNVVPLNASMRKRDPTDTAPAVTANGWRQRTVVRPVASPR